MYFPVILLTGAASVMLPLLIIIHPCNVTLDKSMVPEQLIIAVFSIDVVLVEAPTLQSIKIQREMMPLLLCRTDTVEYNKKQSILLTTDPDPSFQAIPVIL